MSHVQNLLLLGLLLTTSGAAASRAAERPVRLSENVENLLVRATLSGNLESFGKGLRGAADQMVYDPQRADFLQPSQWNEYGVGYGQDLGVVPEEQPAWWMAQPASRWRSRVDQLSRDPACAGFGET